MELVGAAPVFADERASGRPVYFSEVIVHRESRIRSFTELRGGSWAYNDPCSLSGYYNTFKRLAEIGEDGGFFGGVRRSGSHLNSIEMVAGGEVDAAAIDSNVLRIQLGIFPKLRERVRVIETWGPFPIQPVVLRSNLHPELKNRLRESLLMIDKDSHPVFAGLGLERFAPVAHDDYASEERALRRCAPDFDGYFAPGRQRPPRKRTFRRPGASSNT